MIPKEKKMDPKNGSADDSISEDEENHITDGYEPMVDKDLINQSESDGSDKIDETSASVGSLDEESESSELEEAQTKIEELTQQYLLARAEAENIRKRTDIEIGNIRKFALENFVRELLSVKDSLDLARSIDLTSGMGDTSVVEKVVEGIDLTIKQLESVFARFEIEEVNPEQGDKLDPDRHQAMTIEETREFEPSHICRVIQRGYLLHNRLLRPAMVIVAKAPEDS
jgi:molecular chaperone GrpE